MSPNAVLASGAKLAEREALLLGTPVDVHPVDAILGSLRRAWGMVRYYDMRIAELAAENVAAIDGPVVSIKRRPLKEEKGAEDPDVEVTETTEDPPAMHWLFAARDRAMDRAVRYSEIALKANISERLVRLAEQRAAEWAPVVDHIVTRLGVRDHPDAPAVVEEALRMLESAAPVIEGRLAA